MTSFCPLLLLVTAAAPALGPWLPVEPSSLHIARRTPAHSASQAAALFHTPASSSPASPPSPSSLLPCSSSSPPPLWSRSKRPPLPAHRPIHRRSRLCGCRQIQTPNPNPNPRRGRAQRNGLFSPSLRIIENKPRSSLRPLRVPRRPQLQPLTSLPPALPSLAKVRAPRENPS